MNFKRLTESGYILLLSILLIAIYLFLPTETEEKTPKGVAKTHEGRVFRVVDGDTIKIADGHNRRHKIRLVGIDAPEKDQMFGKEARKALADKIYGRFVTIKYSERDTYGRILGKVYHQGRWINKEMVAEGWAWRYKGYSESTDLTHAERTAKKNSWGLWKDRNPIPPWEYRHRVTTR